MRLPGKLALALGVPAALLLLLEGTARVLDLGRRSGLVHLEAGDAPGTSRVRALGISSVDHVSAPFPDASADDAFRVVLVGESAAAGFPYQPKSTPAVWLRLLLEARCPDRTFEIVDTSIPGIQSDFFPPIARLAFDPAPDLVIVYAGNNEFLMSFLALQESRGAAFDLAAKLRARSAAVRWLNAALTPDRRELTNPRSPLTTTVFFDEPLGALATTVLDRFRANLDVLADEARARGADVLVVRPVAAHKNSVPKSSVFSKPLDEATRERFAALLRQARRKLSEGDVDGAAERIEAAAAIDADVAILAFRDAERRESTGDLAGAAAAYRRALDLDERPVRINARSAATLEAFARDHGFAWLDAQAAFVAAGDDGTVGDDLALDHVHLTVKGQRLLAARLVDEIEARGWVDGRWTDADVPLADGVKRLGLDPQTALFPEVQLGFLALFMAHEAPNRADYLDQARRRSGRVLGRRPDDALATAGRGVLAVAEGRIDDALNDFGAIADRSPATIGTLASMLGTHAALRDEFARAGLEIVDGRVRRTSDDD